MSSSEGLPRFPGMGIITMDGAVSLKIYQDIAKPASGAHFADVACKLKAYRFFIIFPIYTTTFYT